MEKFKQNLILKAQDISELSDGKQKVVFKVWGKKKLCEVYLADCDLIERALARLEEITEISATRMSLI